MPAPPSSSASALSQRLAQLRQRRAAQEGAEEQAVGLRAPGGSGSARRQVVGPVQAQRRDRPGRGCSVANGSRSSSSTTRGPPRPASMAPTGPPRSAGRRAPARRSPPAPRAKAPSRAPRSTASGKSPHDRLPAARPCRRPRGACRKSAPENPRRGAVQAAAVQGAVEQAGRAARHEPRKMARFGAATETGPAAARRGRRGARPDPAAAGAGRRRRPMTPGCRPRPGAASPSSRRRSATAAARRSNTRPGSGALRRLHGPAAALSTAPAPPASTTRPPAT